MAGAPEEVVMPRSNQHIAPALWPTTSTPASSASQQQLVDAVGAPDRDQVEQAAAADVDHVLGEEVGLEVDRGVAQAEQGDLGGLGTPAAERAAEAVDLVVGITAGGRQQADPG